MQRVIADELMDADDLDPATYARVLADLDRANGYSFGARPTLAFLDAVVARHQPKRLRILDVGSGSGWMLKEIDQWQYLSHKGLKLELLGIDLNPRSEAVGRSSTPRDAPIDYRTGDYANTAGEGWDIVISSLVTHHMTDAQRTAFLRFMEREARLGWFVNDLQRSRIARSLFSVGAAALRLHPIVRHDGALSVARGFVRDEWLAMLAGADITAASVRPYFPYRLCVERHR